MMTLETICSPWILTIDSGIFMLPHELSGSHWTPDHSRDITVGRWRCYEDLLLQTQLCIWSKMAVQFRSSGEAWILEHIRCLPWGSLDTDFKRKAEFWVNSETLEATSWILINPCDFWRECRKKHAFHCAGFVLIFKKKFPHYSQEEAPWESCWEFCHCAK